MKPGGLFLRFIANIIDLCIILLWSLGILLIGGGITALFAIPGFIKKGFFPPYVEVPSTVVALFLGAITILILIALPYIYYCKYEASKKMASPGQAAMGLQICTLDYKQISKLRAFAHVLLDWIVPKAIELSVVGMALLLSFKTPEPPKFLIGLGISTAWMLSIFLTYLPALFTAKKQTLYDVISGVRFIEIAQEENTEEPQEHIEDSASDQLPYS